MDFTGKICPYCKTEFKEGDDIVVCSICEMPHHKDCWIENKACTTFGCTGTIVGADQYSEDIENRSSFCSSCGAALRSGQKFCPSCGNPVGATGEPHFRSASAPGTPPMYQQPNPYQQTNMYQQPNVYQQQYGTPQYGAPRYNSGYDPFVQQIDPDMAAFIKTNQETYLMKFRKMQANNTNASWNWCSFLFGALWFAYRKLYIAAAVYIAVAMISGFIPVIGTIIQIGLVVCSGIFGNYFYKQYIDKELPIAKSMDQFDKQSYIEKRGGTSIAAVIGIIGAEILFWIILSVM